MGCFVFNIYLIFTQISEELKNNLRTS